MNKTLLRIAVKAILEEAFDTAKPMADIMIKAMREDWQEGRVNAAIANAIETQMLDIIKNYDYFADKIVALLDGAGDA